MGGVISMIVGNLGGVKSMIVGNLGGVKSMIVGIWERGKYDSEEFQMSYREEFGGGKTVIGRNLGGEGRNCDVPIFQSFSETSVWV